MVPPAIVIPKMIRLWVIRATLPLEKENAWWDGLEGTVTFSVCQETIRWAILLVILTQEQKNVYQTGLVKTVMCIANLEMIHLANTSAQLMEALYVLAIGMVGTVPCIALRRMILKVTIVVIHEQGKGFVSKTGMEKIAAQTVFLKITTGLVITTAIRPTAVNSVIGTGMDRVALSSARLAMILADITCAKKLMVAKFVWRTGLELSARGIAKH